MLKLLKKLFGTEPNVPLPKQSKPGGGSSKGVGDFRAVEISPRVFCCAAAKLMTGKRILLRNAPRMPLIGCTMPTSCACMFLKSKDRRGGDRRLLGAGVSRWFAGVEGRKDFGRRLAER